MYQTTKTVLLMVAAYCFATELSIAQVQNKTIMMSIQSLNQNPGGKYCKANWEIENNSPENLTYVVIEFTPYDKNGYAFQFYSVRNFRLTPHGKARVESIMEEYCNDIKGININGFGVGSAINNSFVTNDQARSFKFIFDGRAVGLKEIK